MLLKQEGEKSPVKAVTLTGQFEMKITDIFV